MDLLESVDAERAKSYRWKERKFFGWLEGTRETPYTSDEETALEEAGSWILDELFDMLGEYCPPYTHFGASEGDGADYGVWVCMDSLEEAVRVHEVAKVADLCELDEMLMENGTIPRMLLEVNDHGNVTLYKQTATLEEAEDGEWYKLKIERSEVWAIV
jgi:hypothetical protein